MFPNVVILSFQLKKKVILQRRNKPASQCLGKVLGAEGSPLTLLQSLQVYFLQILQAGSLGLGQKHVCVGQEQCQGSSPQGPRADGPHPHGEEAWILEERHFWRLRGRKMTLPLSQDGGDVLSNCQAQPAATRWPGAKCRGAAAAGMGWGQAAEHVPPQELDATDTRRFLPEELTRESGALRETAAPSDAPPEFPRPGPGLPPALCCPSALRLLSPSQRLPFPHSPGVLAIIPLRAAFSSVIRGHTPHLTVHTVSEPYPSPSENPSERDRVLSILPRQFQAGPPLR